MSSLPLQMLVTDTAWPSTEPEATVLAAVGAHLVLAQTGDEAELLELVPRADGLLTCWANVPASVIRAGTRLQVIGRFGIGVDNIAVDEATRLGIPVTNVPTYCLDEVAEHTLALILALARQVCQYNRGIRAARWETRSGAPLHRIRGRTLGVVGFGRIGRALASKALGLGLRVITFDPYVDSETVAGEGCQPVDRDTLLATADFVSIHVPLKADTYHLIGETELRRMKHTAYIVNTSRGGVIDQDALTRALQEGWIAGAGLDVFEPERLPATHPLLQLPNVVATPHVAFYSEESLLDLEVLAAENVAAILSGQRPTWVVNAEVLDLPRWSHLR